jgi:hypothetical protein
MPYTPPQFNISVNWWNPGHTPSADPPDATFNAQVYLPSRAANEVMDSTIEFHYPTVWFRLSIASWMLISKPAVHGVLGYTDDTGYVSFYDLIWWNVQHSNFPNAYVECQTMQCDSARGVPDVGR